MFNRVMGKLNARRNHLTEDNGFTLIELLVVVIIIGILAAIAIPVYLTVQNNAKASSVQSDITNVKTALVAYETTSGKLPDSAVGTGTTPADFGDDLADSGFKGISGQSNYQGDTDNIKVNADSSGAFCIYATAANGKTYAADTNSGVTEGTCSGTALSSGASPSPSE